LAADKEEISHMNVIPKLWPGERNPPEARGKGAGAGAYAPFLPEFFRSSGLGTESPGKGGEDRLSGFAIRVMAISIVSK